MGCAAGKDVQQQEQEPVSSSVPVESAPPASDTNGNVNATNNATTSGSPSSQNSKKERALSPSAGPFDVSGDKPFADDCPTDMSAADDSTDSDPFHQAMIHARRGRSASVAKLQEIALKREQEDPVQREEEDKVAPHSPDSPEASSEAILAPVRSQRHRRLSSIYSDFSSQMSEFWKQREADGEGEDSEAQEHTLRRMFDNLDIHGTGYITRDALEEGFRRMGLTSSSQQVRTMFDLADKDHDNKLGFRDFFTFFRSIAALDAIRAEEADELDALRQGALPAIRRRAQSISVRFLRNFTMRFFGGFQRRVKSIALSQTRPIVAAVDRDDKVAHIFDENGKELRRLIGHTDSMLAVVFSPDRKTIATASRDCTLNIWDCTVGHELCSCRHPGVVTACDFSFDGKYIYTGCQDNLVRKLVTSKGRCHRLMERLPQSQLGVIVALGAQMTMDRKVIMSRSCDTCAYVLDADKLCVIGMLAGHSGMVWHCCFNHDDGLMLTQCDKFVKVWSGYDHVPRFSVPSATMPGPKKPPARRSRMWTTVAFGPPDFGSLIIAAANDGMVYVLRVDTGDVLVAIEVKSSVYALAVGALRNTVMLGDDVGNLFELQLH